MNECKFVLLDLFWDKDLNNGTIRDINPIYDGEEYWWKCYNCEESYLSTVNRVLLDFKMNKNPQLNNYCSKCKQKRCIPRFDYADVLKYVFIDKKEFISELAGDFLDRGNCTYTFYTFCPDCGKFHSASQGTFKTRNGFYCKNCASIRKALVTHGSIASELPEVLPYYSDKNKLPADKVPIWKINVDGNNIIVNCPSCGKEITKRMDALINNGAYCGPCAKQKNAYKNGNSLYENYPEVAEMFDKGGNDITSKEISYGSNKEYNFLCENGGIPHIITRKVYVMASASKKVL